MRKAIIYSVLALAVAGCSKETDLYQGEQTTPVTVDPNEIAANVENVFGTTFDPNQDWKMINFKKVTVTADAEESDQFKIARVQVLTANPFIPTAEAKVLNEAQARHGQKVSLSLDVPNYLDTLYAACVSAEGYYRVTPFPVGQTEVSFPQPAASRATRAEVAVPVITSEGRNSDNLNMLLKPNKSTSYTSNATREDQWENSGWSDKFYDIETTVQDVADFTQAERNDLYNVLTGIMPENTNNSDKVMQSEYLINTANYFFADGSQKPITITPVRCGADLLGWESLYYYYYNPAQVEGKSDEERAQFLKSLPKFKLLECADALVGLDKGATPEERVAYAKRNYNGPWRNVTRRSRTYTLAYFGDGEPTQGTTGSYQFPRGYRIGLMFRVDSVPEHPQLVSQSTTPVKSAVNFYADTLLNNEANLYAKWYYGWNSAERKNMINYLGVNKSRAAIFSANGKAYIGFEDLVDKDFNDVIFEVDGGVTLNDPKLEPDNNVYTMAWEDTPVGDYDLNDVVIKAQRKDNTHVLFSLEASGAWDELYLRNINGQVLNTTTEVHAIFGQTGTRGFVNTVEDDPHVAPVRELIEVPADFTFTDNQFLPYIYNKTKNVEVHLARKGDSPHGIIIPYDFRYPREYKCVKLAYPEFNKWGEKKVDETDWYLYPVLNLIYTKSVFAEE